MFVHRLSWLSARSRLGLRAPILVLGAFLALSAQSAMARPLTPAEQRLQSYSGLVPSCDEASALRDIQSRFNDRESEYWHSGLEIVAFDRVDEIGFRSNGLDYIPRRYCLARAVMSDQKLRTVSFSIGEATGSIGFTAGVEFCVGGLDRLNTFSPDCKMARP